MQIGRQGLHNSDFTGLCTNERSHELCSHIVDMQEGGEIRAFMFCKVAEHPFCCPRREVGSYALRRPFWLRSQGVSAKVNASAIAVVAV